MPTKKVTKKYEGPKILFFDLETSHSLMAAFGLYDQIIPHGNILGEWSIISVAWKWQHEKKTHSLSSVVKKSDSLIAKIDDKKLIEEFIKVLESADVVVGHNIDKFDIKKFKARMIFHGFKPMRKLYTIDTLKIARKEFAFTSNRLDYLATHLGLKGKMTTPTGLWMDVLRGDQKAVKTMVKYNIQDVVVLENVYDKLIPFSTNRSNLNLFMEEPNKCPKCGGNHLRKDGFNVTNTGRRQMYECGTCGAKAMGRLRVEKRDVQIVPA